MAGAGPLSIMSDEEEGRERKNILECGITHELSINNLFLILGLKLIYLGIFPH